MSTHTDRSNNEYIELDKRLGAAEYELVAEIAQADEVLDAAVQKGKTQAKTARARLKRKAAERSRKHESDGLQRYSLEATAGRSDLTALPELVRAQSLSHR